jgi:molybdopterin/thiamine biosynthesis adenylyltransferase
MISYNNLTARNSGYVSEQLQARIRETRLLIAGVGVGSYFAEAAVRLGFTKITLVDGDTVDVHNLNRQAYDYADVGSLKVTALSRRLTAINPGAEIDERPEWITPMNADALVRASDLVFDTIDFLDLAAIVAVHDCANQYGKHVISAVSCGWGAAALYFPPSANKSCGFRKIFGLPEFDSVENASYVSHFKHFIDRIADHLDASVVAAMAKALTVMEDGTPCPAPHVSAGSFAVASLAVTMAARILNDEIVCAAPRMILANMGASCAAEGVDLTP